MSDEKKDFAAALKIAQEKGYAEADPTFDIEGIDTAHKVIILMELAFNAFFDFSQLYIEGISAIESNDIELAKLLGYKIKLLGKARNSQKGFEGRVHPALVNADSMLASVQGAFNAISVYGNFVGHTLSYGAGAGSHPTASAVVGDIIDISRRLAVLGGDKVPPLGAPLDQLSKQPIIPINEIESAYCIRFDLQHPKEETQILKQSFEESGIDLFRTISLSPNPIDGKTAVAMLTDTVQEKKIQSQLERFKSLSFITRPPKLIRVEA
jgi:homoserine dehydrogenase